jgi:hypothetical protein
MFNADSLHDWLSDVQLLLVQLLGVTPILIPYLCFNYIAKIKCLSKSSVFCDITRCNLLKGNRRFGGTCHLQRPRISEAKNKREAGSN